MFAKQKMKGNTPSGFKPQKPWGPQKILKCSAASPGTPLLSVSPGISDRLASQ